MELCWLMFQCVSFGYEVVKEFSHKTLALILSIELGHNSFCFKIFSFQLNLEDRLLDKTQ